MADKKQKKDKEVVSELEAQCRGSCPIVEMCYILTAL